MKLLNSAIIKLTACLVTGILIGYYFRISVAKAIFIAFIFLILLTASYIVSQKQFIKTIWFGLFSFLFTISLGLLTTVFHNQENFSNHYSKLVSTNKNKEHTIIFNVREVLKPNNYYDKYVINILKVNNQEAKGKVLLSIKKDTSDTKLKVDDILIASAKFNKIKEPLNPYQFNYKNYLTRKHIHHQINSSYARLYTINTMPNSVLGYAHSIRDHIKNQLEQENLKPNELAIILALTLGKKHDINKKTYNNYINSGAIHILAVSGLHVGIILIILSFILKPLESCKNGKIIKTTTIVLLLWGFALITGLSASVTRATTMFSILIIASNLKRPTNTYNTLTISMLLILLFKPLSLFDIGFQLSYLAVLAIVSLDKYLYKLWQPKNWILDKYWHTLTISFSAQLGVLPLSLFYFNQFPTLFLITNLIIVPFLGLILGLCILTITLAALNILPDILTKSLGKIIEAMNNVVAYISNQELFIIKNISFDLLDVFLAYSIIVSISLFLIRKHFSYLLVSLVCVVCIQLTLINDKIHTDKNELIIFHKNKYSIIGELRDNVLFYSDEYKSKNSFENSIISDYLIQKKIKHTYKIGFKNIYKINNNLVLVIDSLSTYRLKLEQPDYVLLRQSPKLNISRLIDSLKPKQIIADGSNYKSYVKHWRMICKKRKLPFHYTGEEGAFIIN